MFELSREIHNHRMNSELSFTEFGKLFEPVAAASIVKRWEEGSSIPAEPRLSQLALILGVTVETIKNEPTREKDLNKFVGGELVNFDSINEKLKTLNSFRPLSKDQIDAINKDKKIEHVWSSNAIEGSTITKYETAAILENGATIHGKSMAEHLATVDLSKAYDYMEELAIGKYPLDEITIRDLNRLVTAGDSNGSSAGQYRVVEAFPNKVPDVRYAQPTMIPEEMHKFVEWSNEQKDILHPVEYAALVHQKLVSIHPFLDGNGRTSRLAMDFVLTSKGYPIINIQSDKKNRDIYMETLRQTQRTNDPTAFVNLVGSYMNDELDNRIKVLSNLRKEMAAAKSQTRLNNFKIGKKNKKE